MESGLHHCMWPEHSVPAKFLRCEAIKYYYPRLEGGETEAEKSQISNVLSHLGYFSCGYPIQRFFRYTEHPELKPTRGSSKAWKSEALGPGSSLPAFRQLPEAPALPRLSHRSSPAAPVELCTSAGSAGLNRPLEEHPGWCLKGTCDELGLHN